MFINCESQEYDCQTWTQRYLFNENFMLVKMSKTKKGEGQA